MAQEDFDKYAARDALVKQRVAELELKMQQWVEQRARELRLTQPMKSAIERTTRRVFAHRFLILPGYSPVRQRFLKMMLTFNIALEPRLLDQIGELARYLARNYCYEWTVSPVTRLSRQHARDVILANADSEFGETPIAPPFAYLWHHPEEGHIQHIGNYGEVYTRALRLSQMGFFNDRDPDSRQRLGLAEIAMKEKILEEKEQAKRASS